MCAAEVVVVILLQKLGTGRRDSDGVNFVLITNESSRIAGGVADENDRP